MIHILEVETLQKWIAKKEVVLIDVREKSEYEESNIEDSILIPLSTLTIDKIKALDLTGKKLAIHCRSGGRSLAACQALVKIDNKLEVYNLEGGITAWEAVSEGAACSIGGKCSVGGCSVK